MTNRPGFDFEFIDTALRYLESEEPGLLLRLSNSRAAGHLIGHARNFLYDVPRGSTLELVSALLNPVQLCRKSIPGVRRVLEYMRSEVAAGSGWVDDSLAYLPAGFGFDGSLYFTFGYDIGVAYPPNASINLAYPDFHRDPREAVYYSVHELHHVGYFHYQKPPRFDKIATCEDLLHLLEYLTHLEGMAVLAAWPRRRAEERIDEWSGDYRAMEDPVRMERCIRELLTVRESLAGRGNEACRPDDFGIIEALSGPERPAYRAGCVMAGTIEAECGRDAVIDLIQAGPHAFFQQYLLLRSDGEQNRAASMPE